MSTCDIHHVQLSIVANCVWIIRWGQFHSRTWSCKVQLPTSSQLAPHKWMLRRPMM